MELKLRMINRVYFCCTLLIVPYGIETMFQELLLSFL